MGPMVPAPRHLLTMLPLLPGLWLLAGCPATAPQAPAAPAALVAGLPPALARLPAAPAASGPDAVVRVRAAVPRGQVAVVVQLVDADNCKSPHLLARAAPSGESPSAQALPAGRLVTLDFLFTDSTRALCGVRWSFTPQAGRQYLVQGASVGSICPATLTDVTQADRPRTPEDLRYRSETGKPCVPLAQARRVPPGMLEGGQVGGDAVLRPLATDDDLKGLITP